MNQPSLFDAPATPSRINDLHTPEAIAERRNRIRLTVAAYGYEFTADPPLMTDAEFDALALAINPAQPTGHPVLDDFFRTEFHPHTGQWVTRHPELDRVGSTYLRVVAARAHRRTVTP